MCLGIPMKIVELTWPVAVCEAEGLRRKVSLQLLRPEEVKPGDYVVVHVGFAIQKVSKELAEESLKFIKELAENA